LIQGQGFRPPYATSSFWNGRKLHRRGGGARMTRQARRPGQARTRAFILIATNRNARDFPTPGPAIRWSANGAGSRNVAEEVRITYRVRTQRVRVGYGFFVSRVHNQIVKGQGNPAEQKSTACRLGNAADSFGARQTHASTHIDCSQLSRLCRTGETSSRPPTQKSERIRRFPTFRLTQSRAGPRVALDRHERREDAQ